MRDSQNQTENSPEAQKAPHSGFLRVLEANSSNFTENIGQEQKYRCAAHLKKKVFHCLAFIPRGATAYSGPIIKIISPLTG